MQAGRTRLSAGLTVVGAVLVMSGVIMALVGEGLRLKTPGGPRGLVSAGELTAALGLACGLAVMVIIASASGRRQQDGRLRQDDRAARQDGRAARRDRVVPDHDAAAEQWLSPLRPVRTGNAPELAQQLARRHYAANGWHAEEPGASYADEPGAGYAVEPGAAFLRPDQPDISLPDHPTPPPGRSEQPEPGCGPAYPAQSWSPQSWWPSEPPAHQVEGSEPDAGPAGGLIAVAEQDEEDTCPLPVISPDELPAPGPSRGNRSMQHGASVRGPFEPFTATQLPG